MSGESKSIDHLVRMANDIGHFFASEPQRADAIAGIAAHLQRAWAPRMLRQIVAYVQHGGAGLDELPRAAVALLKVPQVPAGTGPVSAAAGSTAASAVSASAAAAGHSGGASGAEPR